MNAVELLDLIVGAILARLYKMLSILRLHPNMNRITQNVWIGGTNHPYFILNEGFEAVVDLREIDDHKYKSYLEGSGIKYLRRPIPDGSGTSPRNLLNIAEWVTKWVKKGARILIHCDLGRGRAALAVCSYLVYSGLDPKNALTLVKKNRRITHLNSQQKRAFYVFVETLSFHKN